MTSFYQDQWWDADADELGERVQALYTAYKGQADTRLADHERWLALYRGWMDVSKRVGEDIATQTEREQMPVNETRAVVDTQIARITRHWPRPMHMTDDADYLTRIRAQRSDQWVEGAMIAGRYEQTARMCFTDAAPQGTGGVKIIGRAKTATPMLERTPPWEILVDELEALYGDPRTMIHWRAIDRGQALRRWPDHEETLVKADKMTRESFPFGLQNTYATRTIYATNSDLILAVEAWHLPSDEEAEDGRHVITVGGEVVLDEKWTRPRFPIAIMRYQPDPAGFWGLGICDLTYRLQVELARMVRDVQRGLLAGRPHMLVPEGFNTTQMTNELLNIWRYNGGPAGKPEIFNPPVFNPEVYNWITQTRNLIWETAGVSRMSGQQLKPTGLESGRSLRVWQDVESERHLVTGRAWEQLAMDVAQRIEDEVRAMAKETGAKAIVVRAPVKGAREWRKLTWADVELPEDAFTWKVYPVSAFASSPAARIEQVYEYIKTGVETGVQIIATDDIPELLDLPDIPAWKRRRLTDRHIVQGHIGKILEDGEYTPPSTFVRFDVALEEARKEYVLAQEDKAPPERLQLVLDYIDEVQRHIDALEEAQAAAAATATGVPPAGVPGATPPPIPGAGPDMTAPEGGPPMMPGADVIPFPGQSGAVPEMPPPAME